MASVFITGVSGFVGSAIGNELEKRNIKYLGATRSNLLRGPQILNCNIPYVDAVWKENLSGVECLIHAAARVHKMVDNVSDPLAEFRRVNVEGTFSLAHHAATAGVKRFIFISSIKVNGEATKIGNPFSSEDIPNPRDPYSISKYEAEQKLLQLASVTDMEVVIIRPPLVYGAGVKANFQTLMNCLYKGTILPLGAVYNKRSLISLDNLVDLIVTCIRHPAAANRVLLAADGEDLSTTELLQQLGTALGRPARLIPLPEKILQVGFDLIGKHNLAQRLCASLQVDITKTQKLLGWTPPITVQEGLLRTARAFLHEKTL